ncbi:hypothetical protein F5Y04DRAFT_281150 [Hypomontagnella monticulosa]|nr:hypothetical protein F5Y04DRAFT_281150 [Hypomontagnella monticulosa]
MDNSTAGDSNSDKNVGNTGMDSATLAGVISTVISFVALIVSSIQLLYQYYTNVSLNALGARNCNERVMGPWAKLTRRRWRWTELRFEVIFDSPILFVAPAWNERRPIPNRDIWLITGTDKSYEETRTPLSVDSGSLPRTTAIRRGVNVEATWVLLLRTLQSMERESERWQDTVRSTEDCEKPLPFSSRTLAVAAQAQTLSWDFVPNFKKPFANTTISHMVEIAAMLGIHWTMWDATVDRYRAEGNGCVLLGSFAAEQGIVFQLLRHDKTEFRQNRLIPSNIIKRLCFGFAPTFYFLDKYDFVPEDADRPMNPIVPLLKLGSRQEVAETMLDIGCPVHVAEYFLTEDARVSHLFPVVFDVLGMLGRTVSVDGSYYRMLPNPTLYRWDRRWFDTKRLLLVFREHLTSLNQIYASTSETPKPLLTIASALDTLTPHLSNPHIKDYSPSLLKALRATMATIDTLLRDPTASAPEPVVLETVAHHVASVVADLRQRPSWFIDMFPLSRIDDGANERNLIAFLFENSRWAATREYKDLEGSQRRIVEARLANGEAWWEGRAGMEVPPLVGGNGDGDGDGEKGEVKVEVREEKESETQAHPWRTDARTRDVAWCLLVFRMLCWLQLHDFHRDDVMIPRSATYGSRMPVYII